jgi:exosortase/archaeosortase
MTAHIIMACASCFSIGLSIGIGVAIRIQRQATAAFNRIAAPVDYGIEFMDRDRF